MADNIDGPFYILTEFVDESSPNTLAGWADYIFEMDDADMDGAVLAAYTYLLRYEPASKNDAGEWVFPDPGHGWQFIAIAPWGRHGGYDIDEVANDRAEITAILDTMDGDADTFVVFITTETPNVTVTYRANPPRCEIVGVANG
jgi:hypothetical protein